VRLTTLGTGTVSLTPERVCAGHHVSAGTVSLLLDCGSGITHRLAQSDVNWRAITHVAFTHFHQDHVGDFATLVFAWKYADRPGRTAPLIVVGPVGMDALLARMAEAAGEWLSDPGFHIDIIEVAPGDTLDLGDGVALSAVKVPHTDESVAYSIARGGRRVVYTGDTGFDPEFGEWARNADVLLCECSLPADLAIPSHLTPEQCGAVAATAQPKHLVLTHFYPPTERIDVRAIVAAHFTGPVTLASDGAGFEIEEG